jgi:hypothetical protein
MWEIVSRQLPYIDVDYGPMGSYLRKHICQGNRPPLDAVRPELFHTSYVQLMQRAWATDQAQRPTFVDIMTALDAMPSDPVASVVVRRSRANSTCEGAILVSMDGSSLIQSRVASLEANA